MDLQSTAFDHFAISQIHVILLGLSILFYSFGIFVVVSNSQNHCEAVAFIVNGFLYKKNGSSKKYNAFRLYVAIYVRNNAGLIVQIISSSG